MITKREQVGKMNIQDKDHADKDWINEAYRRMLIGEAIAATALIVSVVAVVYILY